MAAFGSVLCAVDFSEHAAQALRCAASMAAGERASLHVVSVIDPLLAEAAADAYNLETLSAETASDLRTFVTTTLGHRFSTREPSVRVAVGRAAREILRAAETVGADLIVLGMHGLGGPNKRFFGGTTDHVLRDATCAVLAVPVSSRTAGTTFERGAPIVVGVELDRRSLTHVDTAVMLAKTYRSPIVLVHAVAPLQAAGRWRSHRERAQTLRRDRAEMALDVISAETPSDVEVEAVIEYGDAPSILVKVADEREAQLIVIGLGGPIGSGQGPGSAVHRVVGESSKPVLAVPDAG